MIRILLVDDHAVVRHGLKQILSEAIPGSSFQEAGSAEEALTRVRASSFDIVILDISLPGENGLESLKEIKQIQPNLPVLILSVYPEEEFAVRTLRAGAAGYVTKQSASTELVDAVRKVESGAACTSRPRSPRDSPRMFRREPLRHLTRDSRTASTRFFVSWAWERASRRPPTSSP